MLKTKRQSKNPLIPGTPKDRTGVGGIIRLVSLEINRRWDGLSRDVLALFGSIRTYARNEAIAGQVLYGLTPEELANLSQALQEALDRWIEAGRDPGHVIWYEPYQAQAAQTGVAQASANLANLSEVYAMQRNLQTIIFSAPYRNRLAIAQLKSYDHWTGLSATTKADISSVIGRAVVDGKNPRAVVEELTERLGVSRSKALQYAQTDITDTLRMARIAEDQDTEESLGIKTRELWTSALKPTTRHWHASRHGKTYTRAEVQDFYGRYGNRYNCFCSVTACLIDAQGKPILSTPLKNTMKLAREKWEKAN